ncbi:MAG: YdbH domain-containing protein [Sphingomonas phyllosphaerae]|uniref:YdbH domain-containing protein n=1 Tax=Sphingomonas phyllosphaerae TaxID=257003 RepID=UPI002FFCD9EE
MSDAARRMAVAVSVLALAAGGGLWLSRVPIATRVIDKELSAKGVPARYHIADLGLGRQRLTDVVIGDPARPDLVADWVETQTDLTLSGPKLIGVRAGHVRIAARLRDGKLSLGAIDRLLPESSGGPFALPALNVDVTEARIALDTPYGAAGLRLSGRGRLNDGFRGRLAATAPGLAVAGCRIDALQADMALRITATAPRVAGPARAAAIACDGAAARALAGDLDLGLSPQFDRWFGRTQLTAARVETAAATLSNVNLATRFRGDADRTTGIATAMVDGVRTVAVTSGATDWHGQWRLANGRATLSGRLTAQHVALAATRQRAIATLGDGAAGLPVTPLLAGAARDAARASRDMQVAAELALATGDRTLLTIERATVTAATGVRATLDDGAVTIGHPAGVQLAGRITLGGGGLPGATIRLAQAAPGAAINGTADIAPYARDGAALALAPVLFRTGGGGATRITTEAVVSGPLAGGRVERLRVPVAALWDRRGQLTVNRDCTPIGFERLSISSLTLDRGALRLCPTGAGLVAVTPGGVSGGARLGATRLEGTLGGSAFRFDAGGATLALADRGFVLTDVATVIGTTRIVAARLAGTVTGGGARGTFAGGGGQVGTVPLLMSAGEGNWRFDGRRLVLDGAMRVADTAAAPRFQPMAARDIAFALDGDSIRATGQLVEPTTSTPVARVAMDHRLSTGSGAAKLTVPGITFAKGFQPELLTRLTFGVIADVAGTMRGQGDIRWTPQGVDSTGTFSTEAMNLAAAFGPVTGLAGTIRFTDLLGLVSAPDQVATVTSINPGIAVTDGRIVYRLLPDLKVQVETARWPFAGGTLTLDPTTLDFGSDAARRMTFRVDGMDAGKFLQQFDFSNLNATGTFDGVLPMIFDDQGGRIADGRLTAREGGGSIAYLGELTEKDLGFWGNLAFQSLRSLTYRSLDVQMNGPLAGEMVTGVSFTGIKQGEGAKSNFLLRRLTRLPIRFNITIRAPFRGLIDSAASFYDPQRLVKRNLQALIDEQNRKTGVQPPASENVP